MRQTIKTPCSARSKRLKYQRLTRKAVLIAKLNEKVADLEGKADSIDTEIMNLQVHLDANDQNVSFESSQRADLYKKAERNDDASKSRYAALENTMTSDYARKQVSTPSQLKKIEEIRKKAREQGI